MDSTSKIVSTDPHTYILNHDIICNPEQTEIFSNTLERNSSIKKEHQPVRSNLFPELVPLHIVNVNDQIINIKQEPHACILNNDISNPGQTADILSNTLEKNSSDQIGLVSSNSTILSTTPMDPWPSMPPFNENTLSQHQLVGSDLFQDRIMNINTEPVQTDQTADHSQSQINIQEVLLPRQQSNVSITQLNLIAHNNSPVLSIKQETNNSDQIGLVNSNSTILSTVSVDPSMPPYDEDSQLEHQLVSSELFPEPVPFHILHEKILNMKEEEGFQIAIRDPLKHKINIQHSNLLRQQSNVSIAPYNSIANNNSSVLNIKQETNLSTTLGETNSSDQVNLSIASTSSHNSMENNCPVLNIKQEKNLSTNVREMISSDLVCLVNSNATIVSTAPHTYIPNNDIISNPGQTEILSNTLERNSSTQIEHQLEESNLIPKSVPSGIFYNRIVNIKQEQHFHTTARDNNQRQINIQQSSASIALRNSIANNNSPVLSIKQETNNSNQINLANSNESIVSTVSQNSMANNCHILNIKQEKNLSTNMRERNSTNQVDSVNSNKSTLANKPRDSMAEQNPVNIANNNIVSTVRETPYFCIRKLPNIKNGFCNDDNYQTSQNNVIFICRICKNSPSTDIHSFALHMSDHSECNMHECTVCNITFKSVVPWTEHMTYHQQQIDLNVSTVQFNLIESDSNTLGPTHSRNTEPQVFRNLRSRKFNISALDDSHSDTTRLNSAKKIKYQYDCSMCNKIFHSKSALKVHQTLHNKSQPFSCRYCDKIFSRKSSCTNHEKSHINSDKWLLQNNENNIFNPIVIQNSIRMEDNKTIKQTNFCNLCKRKFTKLCYFMNHMTMKHKIIINTPKQLTLANCNESIIRSENIELSNEYENKLSTAVINKNNNLNVNIRNKKKSKFCMLCNKHFAHLGALTNHMRIHSYTPYKCQYCHMQFSRKGLYILHEKTHVLKNEVESTPSRNKNNIVVEVNDEPQVEHYNSFEIIHTPVDGNSSGKNLADLEPLWFPCDVCEKKFSTPFQLNAHRKSHSGIVPYICKICDKSYQLKFHWNRHLKGHYKKPKANL